MHSINTISEEQISVTLVELKDCTKTCEGNCVTLNWSNDWQALWREYCHLVTRFWEVPFQKCWSRRRKECIRHTRERCCIIKNFNADRFQYNEIPQTPPLTPGSSHSLPASLRRFKQLQSRELPEPRRRPSTVSENLELIEFRKQPKNKERKGER